MKKKIHRIFTFLVLGLLLVSPFFGVSQSASAIEQKPLPVADGPRVKNVIFFIGDGMGLAQIYGARIKLLGADDRLQIERMPFTGLVNTHSANELVTDSAAAGTALACGIKTNNGMIGMTPEKKKVMSIFEVFKLNGKATGIVVTSSVTHATPAAFGSHVISRKMEAEIARQLLSSDIDVIMGGGKDYFIPQSKEKSLRKDDIDLIAGARQIGYEVIEDLDSLEKTKAKKVLALFQPVNLTTKPPEPSMAQMTGKAIAILSQSEKGFILMVEGSQIDWELAKNKTDEYIHQLKLLDEAVKIGLDFAEKDGQTLVIVTGDHETGGVAILNGRLAGEELKVAWGTKSHTAVPVPIFAYGPGADQFTGMYDNTKIPRKLAKISGIENFPRVVND